jgi:dTMP kinase
MAAIWGRHLMFISLEGVDGSGKSTQARLLVEALGEGTVAIREPGGTEAAERIRDLLADPSVELEPLAELMLFLAARAEVTERVIRPALETGRHVVADRFSDSSVAYQGSARGLGVGEVIGLCDTATDGLWPDLTLLLRLDPKTGLGRAESDDRFEQEGLGLQQAVAQAYEEIAQIASDRVTVIDASGSVEEVHRRVMEAVEARVQ